MRTRYQRGYLRLGHRKTRPACWEFLWWDNVPEGRRVRRKAIIGTVLQYPNVEDAWQASNGLRVSINEARNRQPEQVITVADLIDHYTKTELAIDLGDEGKSPATRIIYEAFLGRWVRPAWGSLNIRGVRTTAVEHWLRQLVRADGNPMAPLGCPSGAGPLPLTRRLHRSPVGRTSAKAESAGRLPVRLTSCCLRFEKASRETNRLPHRQDRKIRNHSPRRQSHGRIVDPNGRRTQAPLDLHYQTIRASMLGVFQELGIAA